MSDEKHPYEKMQDAMKEIQRLDDKVKEYKKRIKAGDFELNIEFETELSKIKLSNLKTPIDQTIIDIEKDYEIVWLDLDKFVSRHVTKPDKIYPKDNLWAKRTPSNIARLVEFVEGGNKLYPPIVEPIEKYNDIAIVDGNHRVALLRFMKVSKVPFLIKKSLIHLVEDLK